MIMDDTPGLVSKPTQSTSANNDFFPDYYFKPIMLGSVCIGFFWLIYLTFRTETNNDKINENNLNLKQINNDFRLIKENKDALEDTVYPPIWNAESTYYEVIKNSLPETTSISDLLTINSSSIKYILYFSDNFEQASDLNDIEDNATVKILKTKFDEYLNTLWNNTSFISITNGSVPLKEYHWYLQGTDDYYLYSINNGTTILFTTDYDTIPVNAIVKIEKTAWNDYITSDNAIDYLTSLWNNTNYTEIQIGLIPNWDNYQEFLASPSGYILYKDNDDNIRTTTDDITSLLNTYTVKISNQGLASFLSTEGTTFYSMWDSKKTEYTIIPTNSTVGIDTDDLLQHFGYFLYESTNEEIKLTNSLTDLAETDKLILKNTAWNTYLENIYDNASTTYTEISYDDLVGKDYVFDTTNFLGFKNNVIVYHTDNNTNKIYQLIAAENNINSGFINKLKIDTDYWTSINI